MGTSPPKPVVDLVQRKTGTVPRRVRRSRSEGLSPVFATATVRVPSPADRKVFLSSDYKEERPRAEFLDPFFTALGWDMDGRRSCDPSRRQAVCGRQPSSSLLSS